MSVLPNGGESLGGRREMGAAGDIAWLAEGEIPKAAVTLLSGEPGSGKSFVACALAASVSQVPDARVVIAHGEPAERCHSRLVRAGAEISRIALLGAGGQGATEGFRVQGSGFSKQQVGQAFQPDAAPDAGRSPDKSKIQNPKLVGGSMY